MPKISLVGIISPELQVCLCVFDHFVVLGHKGLKYGGDPAQLQDCMSTLEFSEKSSC